MSIRRAPLVAGLLVMAVMGCGSPPTGPRPPSGPQTVTFSGTAFTTDTGGCNGPGHIISTGAGTITVTNTQSSAPRLKVQVCHPTAMNHALECTIPPFVWLRVGESTTATLRGGRVQDVTVFTDECGTTKNAPPATLTYTVTVSYPGG